MKETHVFMGFKIRFCVIKIQEIQGEDRKKWPPMKIGFLDYNFVKRAENVEKFINRTVQLPNMTEGLTLLNLKCNFHHKIINIINNSIFCD